MTNTDQTITPDEARELLNGTTPREDEPDTALIAAALKMAHTLAGMREEWGVSCGGKKPGAWWASHEEADQCAKRMSIGSHYQRPIVVVRRYVTEAMEA